MRRILAVAALAACLAVGVPTAASAQPMPACGAFSGFDDCQGGDPFGGGGGGSDIILQPAPEEPWVWPSDTSVGVPNPARKRDRPQERNQVTGQWQSRQPLGGNQGGGGCVPGGDGSAC